MMIRAGFWLVGFFHTASEMTYTVSSGALNSTQTKLEQLREIWFEYCTLCGERIVLVLLAHSRER